MNNNIEVSGTEIAVQQEYMQKVQCMAKDRSALPLAYVDTYGCQQNESDSEKLRGMLIKMGYTMTEDEYSADVIVINTCAIREHAENRVLGNVGELVHTREKNKNQIIVFCGCLAGVPESVERIRRSYEHVNLVFPPNELWRFPEHLYNAMSAFYSKPRKKRVFIGDPETARLAEGIPVYRSNSIKAWLPIMYGCNNFCAYCIVPYVRGRERSRRPEEILREAEELVTAGYKDITLLGQNVNSYKGRYSAAGGADKTMDFPELIRKICNIDGDFLVRFMTSHPKDATEDLFKAMSESGKVARHIHLPFQAGSDKILKMMNRGYTAEEYLEKITMARRYMPDIVITSDVIAGFPGESEEDFEDTMSLVRSAEFEAMFTFIYSKRPGTPAAKLTETNSREEIQERFERLVDLQNEISLRHHDEYIGKIMRVLTDGSAPGAEYPLLGRTNGGRLVHIKGNPELTGKFINVKITGSNNWSVYGEHII